jgi:curved DNA-binding protein CbpA
MNTVYSKDYYQILGVDKSSNMENIKNAYTYHMQKFPFINSEQIKDIKEAYIVLSDKNNKEIYDSLIDVQQYERKYTDTCNKLNNTIKDHFKNFSKHPTFSKFTNFPTFQPFPKISSLSTPFPKIAQIKEFDNPSVNSTHDSITITNTNSSITNGQNQQEDYFHKKSVFVSNNGKTYGEIMTNHNGKEKLVQFYPIDQKQDDYHKNIILKKEKYKNTKNTKNIDI